MSRLLIRDLHPDDAETLQKIAEAMKLGNVPFAIICDGRRTLAAAGKHIQRFAVGVLDGAGMPQASAPVAGQSVH